MTSQRSFESRGAMCDDQGNNLQNENTMIASIKADDLTSNDDAALFFKDMVCHHHIAQILGTMMSSLHFRFFWDSKTGQPRSKQHRGLLFL